MDPEASFQDIFEKYRVIAVYGMSKNPAKPSHSVPVFLLSRGYRIIPINPGAEEIAHLEAYPGLQEVPEPIDILEVFRPSEQALEVVQEAIERKRTHGDIAVIWLQEGIRNESARELAEAAGIRFVQDRCMYKEFKRLFPEK